MSEPVCSHCNKTLSEALRRGCDETFCGQGGSTSPAPKSSERGHKRLSERFGVAYDGWRYWVIDAHSQNWYQMDTKKAADDKAAEWNYQWGEMLDGRDRFSDDIA